MFTKTNTFTPDTDILSSEVNANFDEIEAFLNNSVVHADASVPFTNVPSGPATDPSTDNQYARKAYVDAKDLPAPQGLGSYGTAFSGIASTTSNFKFTGGRQDVVFTAGAGTLTFPAAFSNGLLVCLTQSGDSVDDNAFLIVVGGTTAAAYVWAVRAGANFSGTLTVNYLAIGW